MARKVIIFGATGSTGRCLAHAGVVRGLQVTAFVRDPAKLAAIFPNEFLSKIRVVRGDALDEQAVADAMAGQEAAVNAAQHPTDPEIFQTICRNIVGQAELRLAPPRRLWLFGGLPGLDVPHTKRMGATLPGMPMMLRSHKINFDFLKESSLDWSFMCPGPMTFDPGWRFGDRLRITTETMPYDPPTWTRWLPSLAHPFIMLRRLPTVTVSYQDVADLVMDNLDPSGPFSRRRVGAAPPKNLTNRDV